jgi:hypothetical protein
MYAHRREGWSGYANHGTDDALRSPFGGLEEQQGQQSAITCRYIAVPVSKHAKYGFPSGF